MSDEYDESKENATLEYKLGFARRVLRMELIAPDFFGAKHAGVWDAANGEWVHKYVEISANAEGSGGTKGSLFDDKSDSEDDEPVAFRRKSGVLGMNGVMGTPKKPSSVHF